MTITKHREKESYYHTQANTLLMIVKRSSDLGAIALVEGPTDKATYSRLLRGGFPRRGSRLHFDKGPGQDDQEEVPKRERKNRKKQVLKQTRALKVKEAGNKSFNIPFFAIVDSDFDKDPCRGFDPGHCYFATDAHDLETLILLSDAFFYRFIDSLIGVSRKELVLFLQQEGVDRCQGLDPEQVTDEEMRIIAIELRSHLLESMVFFGDLRFYNQSPDRVGGRISFTSKLPGRTPDEDRTINILAKETSLRAPKYIDQETARLDREGVLYKVVTEDRKKVLEASKEYAESKDLPEGLRCQGHDLVIILVVALRRFVDEAEFNKCSAARINWQDLMGMSSTPLWLAAKKLEEYIQSSYSLEEFKETRLYRQLEVWMKKNVPAPA